jgi:hypothetical protein
MCVRKTPLAEVFYFLPGNGARKVVACCVVDDQPIENPKRKV